YRGAAPKSAEALAELAKKDPDLFPHRQWVKTIGIGKLPDGFFIVGKGKAFGFEHDTIGAVRTIDGKTVLFMCVPATEAAERKEMLGVVRSAKFGPEAPPDPGPSKSSSGKKPRLADLKFTLPKGWEAKYSDAVTWRISHGGFVPSISVWWMVSSRYPKDLDDLVKKLQETNYLGNGLYLTSVSEKANLSDGLYVVGKFKEGKAGKEAKYMGF